MKGKVLLHTDRVVKLTRHCGSQKCKLGIKVIKQVHRPRLLPTAHRDVCLWLRQYLSCKLLEALTGQKGNDHCTRILLLTRKED